MGARSVLQIRAGDALDGAFLEEMLFEAFFWNPSDAPPPLSRLREQLWHRLLGAPGAASVRVGQVTARRRGPWRGRRPPEGARRVLKLPTLLGRAPRGHT